MKSVLNIEIWRQKKEEKTQNDLVSKLLRMSEWRKLGFNLWKEVEDIAKDHAR